MFSFPAIKSDAMAPEICTKIPALSALKRPCLSLVQVSTP